MATVTLTFHRPGPRYSFWALLGPSTGGDSPPEVDSIGVRSSIGPIITPTGPSDVCSSTEEVSQEEGDGRESHAGGGPGRTRRDYTPHPICIQCLAPPF
ncbi:unnamed protein product [Arctogadus glacialis]